MNGKNLITGGLLLVALVTGFLAYYRPLDVNLTVQPNFGAQSGPDFFNPVVFHNEVSITDTMCQSATYTIPALSPRQSILGAGASHTSTTVSFTNGGIARGDMVLVSYEPPSATGTLAVQGLVAFGSATTSAAFVEFWNPTSASSTAVASGTLKVCYFD